jgi:hypothetical protein
MFKKVASIATIVACVGGMAMGCSSEAEPTAQAETAQAWSVATDSALNELGIAQYAVVRERDVQGFSLLLGDKSGKPVDVVRVYVESDGRLMATLKSVENEFVFWTAESGWGGAQELRGKIALFLAAAGKDAVAAIDAAGGAAKPATSNVGIRAGLIDGNVAPLLDETAPVTCPTGLVQAVASAGALIVNDSAGAPPPGEGVSTANTGTSSESLQARVDGVRNGTANPGAASACGNRETLVAQVDESQFWNCVAAGLTTVAGGAGLFVCGGSGPVVYLCGAAALATIGAGVAGMCANRCGVRCTLRPNTSEPNRTFTAVCPWRDTPNHCCLTAPNMWPQYIMCRSDGFYRPGATYTTR